MWVEIYVEASFVDRRDMASRRAIEPSRVFLRKSVSLLSRIVTSGNSTTEPILTTDDRLLRSSPPFVIVVVV